MASEKKPPLYEFEINLLENDPDRLAEVAGTLDALGARDRAKQVRSIGDRTNSVLPRLRYELEADAAARPPLTAAVAK